MSNIPPRARAIAEEVVEYFIREGNYEILEMLMRDDFLRDLERELDALSKQIAEEKKQEQEQKVMSELPSKDDDGR